MKGAFPVLFFPALLCIIQCQVPISEQPSSTESELTFHQTYYQSGELKNEFFLNQDSVMEKIFREYSPEGRLYRSIEYQEGRMHGNYVTYTVAGDTASIHQYRKGLPDGPFFWYRPDGTVWHEGMKIGGHDHGPEKEYFEDGSLRSIANYHNGKRYERSYWYYSDGSLERYAYYGVLGQKCFQMDFTQTGAVQNVESLPLADLTVKADDFKRQMLLAFSSACPPQGQCEFSLFKERNGKVKALKLYQEGTTFRWSENIRDDQTFFYRLRVELKMPDLENSLHFEQKIKVVPDEKLEFALL